jgi:two-component system, response regulator
MKNKIILLVEDNPEDIKLTRRAFHKSNIANELVVVHDGVEALHYLRTAAANQGRDKRLPAITLLDLKLPKIDGLEVLRQIRGDEQLRLLPVVILTSSKEEQDIVRSYGLGANSYIRKPVDFDQFVNAVNQLGLYWLLLNEAPPRTENPK